MALLNYTNLVIVKDQRKFRDNVHHRPHTSLDSTYRRSCDKFGSRCQQCLKLQLIKSNKLHIFLILNNSMWSFCCFINKKSRNWIMKRNISMTLKCVTLKIYIFEVSRPSVPIWKLLFRLESNTSSTVNIDGGSNFEYSGINHLRQRHQI